MSEFTPVETVDDLNSLDDDEIVAGYRSGFRGEPEPGSDKSRAFWHGWRNGRVDIGLAQPDVHQALLVRSMYPHIGPGN